MIVFGSDDVIQYGWRTCSLTLSVIISYEENNNVTPVYLPFSENNGTRDIWHCVCEQLFTIKGFPFVFIKHID